MPWIYKFSTPIGYKGEIACHEKEGSAKIAVNKYISFQPFLFPDLFEFVEEKSDSTILGEWFIDRWIPQGAIAFAERLLKANAIKPEFLEKLRRS